MPWKIIAKALGMGDGGSIGTLLAAMRSALGLGEGEERSAVDRARFTAAVIGLSAKLSKSDGVALKIEADTFERLFPVPPDEIRNVRRLYNLAAQDIAGFETYAADVARALADDAALRHDVLEAMLHIATADGVLHEGEDRYLGQVASIFGCSTAEYNALRAQFVADPEDPYVVLGASRDMTDEELKLRHRNLVKEHHPDVLAAKGLADELAPVAYHKLAVINAAWDEIVKERGL